MANRGFDTNQSTTNQDGWLQDHIRMIIFPSRFAVDWMSQMSLVTCAEKDFVQCFCAPLFSFLLSVALSTEYFHILLGFQCCRRSQNHLLRNFEPISAVDPSSISKIGCLPDFSNGGLKP